MASATVKKTGRLPLRGGLLLACLPAMSACLAPDPGFGPWSKVPERPTAARPIWRLAPRAESSRKPCAATNPSKSGCGSERAFGAFKTEIQANLDGAAGVVSYPLPSEARPELAPGKSAELVVTVADGLPRPGVYEIAAGIQVIDLALVESTDYVNPDMPAVRLVVE